MKNNKVVKAVLSAIVKSIDWRTLLGAVVGAITATCTGCTLLSFHL